MTPPLDSTQVPQSPGLHHTAAATMLLSNNGSQLGVTAQHVYPQHQTAEASVGSLEENARRLGATGGGAK